jgi:hypothetical protein
MAQAAQSEAMPSKDEGPLATKEVEAERALRRNAAASAAFKMSAVDAKARRERMLTSASRCKAMLECLAMLKRASSAHRFSSECSMSSAWTRPASCASS